MFDRPTAIYLTGPIGTGKSTQGASLAEALNGRFIEGDDHSDPTKPWYGSALSTARSILETAVASAIHQPVVVAYPLRHRDWLFHKDGLAKRGIRMVTVCLLARHDVIVNPMRGRQFSSEEQARIERMIAEGYGNAPFADLTIATNSGAPSETLRKLLDEIERISKFTPSPPPAPRRPSR